MSQTVEHFGRLKCHSGLDITVMVVMVSRSQGEADLHNRGHRILKMDTCGWAAGEGLIRSVGCDESITKEKLNAT